MSSSRITRALLAPAVIMTAGACFATRSDVRVLQADLQVVLNSGRIVRVPAGFDAATLRQLLAILEERPC